tara:strand:+ start:80 stop:493 length:414 start_codon:yes stop_codon:yes gene_type:complete
MRLSSIALALTTIGATLVPVMANMPDSAAGSFKVEALCTISNAYATCHPQINGNRLIINFPSELVVLDKDEVKSIDLYDSRRRKFIRFFKKQAILISPSHSWKGMKPEPVSSDSRTTDQPANFTNSLSNTTRHYSNH